MGQHRFRIFLKVVGRKHIVFRGHKLLEKTPGATGAHSECLRVGSRDRVGARYRRRKTGPSRDRRRQYPQDHEWSGDQPGTIVFEHYKNCGSGAQRDAASHALVKSTEIETVVNFACAAVTHSSNRR